jgi:hypothetical protein
MRLLLKASLILLVTIGVQYIVGGSASGGALDEAQFTKRVYVANLGGKASDDANLLDEASKLQMRQEERDRRLHPERWRLAELRAPMRSTVAVADLG